MIHLKAQMYMQVTSRADRIYSKGSLCKWWGQHVSVSSWWHVGPHEMWSQPGAFLLFIFLFKWATVHETDQWVVFTWEASTRYGHNGEWARMHLREGEREKRHTYSTQVGITLGGWVLYTTEIGTRCWIIRQCQWYGLSLSDTHTHTHTHTTQAHTTQAHTHTQAHTTQTHTHTTQTHTHTHTHTQGSVSSWSCLVVSERIKVIPSHTHKTKPPPNLPWLCVPLL